jgi:hypothetical protein
MPEPELAEDVIDDNEAIAEAVAAVDQPKPTAEKPKKQAPAFTHRDLETRQSVEPEGSDETAVPVGYAEADPLLAATATRSSKPPKIPNFGRLQKSLLWGFLLVVAVVGYFVGMYFLTTSKVTLFVAASKLSVSDSFTADPAGSTNIGNAFLAAQTVKMEKDLTEPVTPTGQKDVGTKATGTVTVKNYCYNPGTLPAGTVFSYGATKFVSNASIVVPDATSSTHNGSFSCSPTTVTASVTAAQNGDSYNIAQNQAMTIAGVPGSGNQLYMTAVSAAQFTGGTSKMATVVTQDDVDKAKNDALAKDKDASLAALGDKVPSGFRALDGSQAQTAGVVTPAPAVGEQATSASVTVHATYSELAVSSADFKTMLDSLEQKQIGAENQIYDDGLKSVKTIATGGDATGARTFKLTADAYGGAKISTAAVAKSLAGKQYGNAMDIAGKEPGVQRVEIIMQPPWAANLPSRVNQIKVVIKVNGIGS